DVFFHDFVPKLLHKVIDQTPNFQYDAILIDEAQDFEKDWFSLLLKVLNPKTISLLITCDGLQGIYARKKFHWSNVGIQARGRVKKFTKSYRNPKEVGRYAVEILPQDLLELMKNDDELLVPEEFAGIKGIVEFYLLENRQNEYQKIAEKIKILLKQKSQILILFRRNLEKMNYKHPFIEELKKQGIDWINMKKWDGVSPGVLITTIYSAKGLEADTVIIPEIDGYTSSDQRQLLYVGITRTIFKLIMTASRTTNLVKKILNLSNTVDY
ncbi:MAG: 3'-5' exonuclease, partial [Promethearchaeota archaeon]